MGTMIFYQSEIPTTSPFDPRNNVVSPVAGEPYKQIVWRTLSIVLIYPSMAAGKPFLSFCITYQNFT